MKAVGRIFTFDWGSPATLTKRLHMQGEEMRKTELDETSKNAPITSNPRAFEVCTFAKRT